MSNPLVRRIMTTVGLAGPALAMFLSGFIGCQKVVIIILLMIALSFDGFTTAGFKSNHNELSPEFRFVFNQNLKINSIQVEFCSG